ncbi:MAG: response regulator [bacterium]|nr:response regulator [bacterium]
MNPLRILIVEDQQVISFANEALLRSKGYNNIVLATNGPEALELTGTFKPNILLMDISLKGKTDGIDAAEQILAQLKIPVIFITGNSHLISDERLLAIRPFDIIIKPVPDWKLLDVVERAALSLPIELPTPQTDDTGHREKREIEFPEELALILVIDDKPGNLYVTSQLIGQYQPQIEIKTTTDPAIGLKMAAEFQPDCILMDFQMPGIDGITMCKRLKTNPDTEHIPVIIITADHVSATGRAKGLEAGADDFLSRPFENIELLAKIKVMLRIKRTEDRLRKLNRNLEKNLREKLDALMESEQRFAAFMDYIPAGVFIKDQHHRIVYLNRYMTDMFDAEDWIGKLAKQRFPEKIAMGMMADDKKIMEQDNLEIEEKIPDKNGILHTYQTHKFAIKQEGKTPLLGGIALDITKRKQAEEALKENKNQLEIRVRARTREQERAKRNLKLSPKNPWWASLS